MPHHHFTKSMAIRLICGDGNEVVLPNVYFRRMTLFANPDIAGAESYRLQCGAGLSVVNILLQRVYNESAQVTIPAEEVSDLRRLCQELGFSGLDNELRQFESEQTNNHDAASLLLAERISRHDVMLVEMQRQIAALRSELARAQSERQQSAQVAELARRVDELVATPRTLEFRYSPEPMFDGIIAYLTRKCGGNVHDRGIVEATASSCEDGFPPRNAADLHTSNEFHSHNALDSWICYDMKERRISLTSYSLKSYWGIPGDFHLKSWVVEVSNDRTSWREVDRRENCLQLDCCNGVGNFPVAHVPSESFRFVRLRITGRNPHMGIVAYFIRIAAFEIFGTLFEA